MPHRLIQVFEHETLRFPSERNGVPFTEADFRALVRFHEQHAGRYFALVHQGVRFAQYVGVLQIGTLTLEILPKADREPTSEAARACWQGVLIDMLRECRLLAVEVGAEARLRTYPGSLLEAYLHTFLTEVEGLVRRGLVRQYRAEESNQPVLKGKLQFSHHLRQNAVHQQRFYVRHPRYDTYHPIHQWLAQALQRIPQLTALPTLVTWARGLLAHFPSMPLVSVSELTVGHVPLNRQTQPYHTALGLARLLLLGHQPDVRGGTEHTLALLFDMNRLFEEYVYRQLKRAEREEIRVTRQEPVYFWENQRVRPDIVIRKRNEAGAELTCVVDTKWKVLRRPQPGDEDLKQMYVYNQYYRATTGVLLYPQVYGLPDRHGTFHPTHVWPANDPAKPQPSCQVKFVQLVENGRLRRNLGVALLDAIFAPLEAVS